MDGCRVVVEEGASSAFMSVVAVVRSVAVGAGSMSVREGGG